MHGAERNYGASRGRSNRYLAKRYSGLLREPPWFSVFSVVKPGLLTLPGTPVPNRKHVTTIQHERYVYPGGSSQAMTGLNAPRDVAFNG
jgi:hypothetical protein